MTTWTRARMTESCGRCGEVVRKGESLLEIRLKGTRMDKGEPTGPIDVKRVLKRCLPCGEKYAPCPADLPESVAPPVVWSPPAMTRVSRGMLPADFKLAQAGDREPGEGDV